MNDLPVWQLPITTNCNTGYECISVKEKYHCFLDNKSLCGKCEQDTDFYENTVESGEVASRPDIACQICYKKWKRLYDVDK